jgi:probable F420-dependent oxidoreductase
MKLDGGLGTDIHTAAAAARRLEDLGYDGGFTAEISHDPFLPLAVAATATERIELGTGIAVAFARNPMNLANIAHDLQVASRGRFILGLGSQIKPHITKRFSMPWDRPAARMRELVLAMRAIWACWDRGEPLAFRGDFYTHTLMTPMFTPTGNEWGDPKVFIAGVGPVMTRVAGEVADGFVSHAFTTAEYFRDVVVPNLEAGLALGGRSRSDFEVTMPLFTVLGDTDEERTAKAKAVRQQIAFYGSTPAYRPVLEHHGWGDAQDELNRLSKQGKWVEMADVIDDSMLAAFAIVGTVEEFPDELARRFGGLIDRLQFYFADFEDQARWAPVVDRIRTL